MLVKPSLMAIYIYTPNVEKQKAPSYSCSLFKKALNYCVLRTVRMYVGILFKNKKKEKHFKTFLKENP